MATRKRHMHGMTKSDRRYKVWVSMKARCTNPKSQSAKDYVLRGITICDEWKTFSGFMGWSQFDQYKPGLQIDRIDNDKGYSPENCRWATPAENSRNKRTNILRKEDVPVIRMLCWSGIRRSHVAKIFSVSKSLVDQIMTFKKWGGA